jgi:Family of unknown function (DUF6150)
MYTTKKNEMTRFLICTIVLFGMAFTIKAQKIYTAKHESEADLRIFVVEHSSQADLLVFKEKYESRAEGNQGRWVFVRNKLRADKKVYFVKYASRADLRICFVKHASQAGWKDLSKSYLLY